MIEGYLSFWAGGVVIGSIAAIVVLWKRRAFTGITFVWGVLAVAAFIVGPTLQYRIEQFSVTDRWVVAATWTTRSICSASRA